MVRMALVALAALSAALCHPVRAQRTETGPLPGGVPPSPIEAGLSSRAETPLRQFGYDRLPAVAPPAGPLLGAVGDEYEVGIGDVLAVTLRGRRDADLRVTVDSAGMMVVADLRPVPAAGRPLRDVRSAVAAEARARLTETDAFVSLSEARQVTVAVLGEVAMPGRLTVGAFAGPLDAVGAAGGILRSGSLRAVSLLRAGITTRLDLYGVFDGSGDVTEMRLRDGDRIVVPPVGPVAAVAGSVGRPGIFELPQGPATVAALAALAGGPSDPNRWRWTRLTVGPDGRERAEEIVSPETTAVARDDILFVAPRGSVVEDRITVVGHVRDPGPRARSATGDLAALARSLTFLPDPHLPFAALQTTDPVTRRRNLVPVDLGLAMAGRATEGATARSLVDDDVLIVLGAADVAFLSSRAVLRQFADASDAVEAGCAGLATLARHVAADHHGAFAAGPVALAARDLRPADLPCPPVFDRFPDLLPLALRHAALLRRGTETPGLYPVLPGGPGGLRPGVVVDRDPAVVTLEGAVRAPGVRTIAQAPSLSGLIGGAADLSRDAYLLLGVVERVDPASGTRRVVTFVPRAVVEGAEDLALAAGDKILVLTEAFVRAMAEADGREPDVEAIPPWLRERWVTVGGAVARPGRVPVGGRVPLAALVDAAGGPTPAATPGSVQITSRDGTTMVDLATAATRPVGPGDAVRVVDGGPAVLPSAVTAVGAVRHPGRHDLRPGDTVADLLARAGGATAAADPAGLVLIRPPRDDGIEGGGARRILVGDGPGRGTGAGSETPIEAGDRLIVPIRRTTVTVEGEVHAPVSVPHGIGRNAADHLAAAGGPTRFADREAARLVLPDGRSRPLSAAGEEAVPPGSTIVVPRDPRVVEDARVLRALGAVLDRLARWADPREPPP